MNYTKWHCKYKPILNGDDCNFMYETYGGDLEFVMQKLKTDPLKVWTIVEGEAHSDSCDNNLWIVNGYHYVNRFGYLITENDCDQDFIEVKY